MNRPLMLFLLAALAQAQAQAQTGAPARDPGRAERLRDRPAIVAPNPSRHTGHVHGYATRAGARLVAKVPVFQPDGQLDRAPLCTLVIAPQRGSSLTSGHGLGGS